MLEEVLHSIQLSLGAMHIPAEVPTESEERSREDQILNCEANCAFHMASRSATHRLRWSRLHQVAQLVEL